MPYIVRATNLEEFDDYVRVNSAAFGFHSTPERVEQLAKFYEMDRSTTAFDGEELVGTAGIFSFDMTVPGGSLPTAGVTWVGVRATHRRRGVLTEMMRHQLDGIHERGEAIATLWAAETPIYPRFGYGQAADGVELRIDRVRTGLRSRVQWSGRTRIVERETALAEWPPVYERVRLKHAGMYSKQAWWWSDRNLPKEERPGEMKPFLVQYEEGTKVLGYVRYTFNHANHEGLSTAVLKVIELVSETDAAYSALWEYIFGVDLINTIEASWRRVDEPLVHMLEDPRRLFRRVQDTLWARIIDVPRALEARAYRADGAITFRIHDSFCSWTEGTYRLEVNGGRARCTATTAEPEIDMSIVELGAIYYGGPRLSSFVSAGRAAGSEKAVKLADVMFSADQMPWCPEVF